MKIGIYYASTSGNTEEVTYQIGDFIGRDIVEINDIAEVGFRGINSYDLLMFGIPTWDYGHLQTDWEEHWQDLDEIDFSDAVVALYGLGDQYGYSDWYLDSMGILYNKLKEKGARIIGTWPNEGYTYDNSKALTENRKHFVGLALDEDSQSMLTEERIRQWSCNVLEEYAELLA